MDKSLEPTRDPFCFTDNKIGIRLGSNVKIKSEITQRVELVLIDRR